MYKIEILEITETVTSESKKPWYRYIISNSENTITGYRSGNKKDVQNFARECVTSLNQKYPTRKPRTFSPVQINVSYI